MHEIPTYEHEQLLCWGLVDRGYANGRQVWSAQDRGDPQEIYRISHEVIHGTPLFVVDRRTLGDDETWHVHAGPFFTMPEAVASLPERRAS